MISSTQPPALAALDAFPMLQRQVGHAVAAQAARVAERLEMFMPRPELVAALDAHIQQIGTGLIALRGQSGAGATSLLCYLAATQSYLLWLPDSDAGAGMEALCAQVLARYNLALPLVPPAANRDATALERLLAEAATTRVGQPIVVLIDQLPDATTVATPHPFPRVLPPGVIVVYACGNAAPPFKPAATLTLPREGATLHQQLLAAAFQGGCDAALAQELAVRADGSFLFVRLANSLLQRGLLATQPLPAGLAALHAAWWRALDGPGQQLALTLAAADQAVPLALAAEIGGLPLDDAQQHVAAWGALLEIEDDHITFHHRSTRAFVTAQPRDGLASVHNAFVALALERTDGQPENLHPTTDAYLMQHFARHLALSSPAVRTNTPPLLTRRWITAQERRTGTMRAAADDAAWLLHVAAEGTITQLVRTAALAGTLATLSRTLPVQGLADAVAGALARGSGREPTLRRAQALIEQLPEGRDKALALRRLGEVCHDHGMRGPAMRMLAAALDLEVPGLPRAWRDEREETLVAFARATIAAGAPDFALGITTRIQHRERRGMIETEVVRWLLTHGALTRAEEVAYAINHENTHEWAMAEVAVGHARAGSSARAAEVLGTLRTATAVAWAVGELACDDARRGMANAAMTVHGIPNEVLRDRALAQVAQALVAGRHATAALHTAELIADDDIRSRTLIDLALLQPPNALEALQRATDIIEQLDHDLRAPLVVALATAYATVGDLAAALQAADMLSDTEARDRAHSRAAAALARQGQHDAATQVAAGIPDDDERFWTLHELARRQGEIGNWHAATLLINQIGDHALRAQAEADVAILRARAGQAAVALDQASLISMPNERLRAFGAIVGPLVQQGGDARARDVLTHLSDVPARSRYSALFVAGLAERGSLAEAQTLAHAITRPLDRMRAFVAIARAAQTSADALQACTIALRVAAVLGRSETFLCLAAAAETLTAAGGAEMLLAAAHAMDDIDTWWN